MATSRLVVVYVVMFVVCASSYSALKLPSYIKPCSRNDPDINTCVLNRGREAIAEISKRGGDRKYNVPSITPLLVTQINVVQNGLNLTFKDVKLFGLDKIQLTNAMVDFKARREEFELIIPRLEIICNYLVSGRILVLPIQGVGPANITLPNLKILVAHDYDLKNGKTGKEHILFKNPTLKLIGKPNGVLQLDNLFGNKQLSDNMNLILNENSEEVIGDVGPAIAEAIGLVVNQIFVGIGTAVAFDDFYPVTA